jgi:RsiW-degrading membrane proteinase PrsW (M82 family)
LTAVLGVLFSVLPVFLFLAALLLIDSYKLVTLRAILLSVAAGVVAALAGYAANVWLRPALHLDFESYSRYVAPIVEETLKAIFVVWLLWRSKVGFVVDAAIHGFGIGTGFALVESLYYLHAAQDAGIWSWIVRGFGTAIMHGGCTAIMAMVSKSLLDGHGRVQGRGSPRPDTPDTQGRGLPRPLVVLPGLAVAIVLHSIYNHFLVQPIIATALIVLVFPWISVAVFQQSERETKSWVGEGFDDDQELLRVVHAGEVSGTPVGRYLVTLRSRFAPEVIVDMMCLLRLHAELAVRAKGVLMMREAGFDAPPDPSVKDKLDELKYLERSIGKTGLRALNPFLHTTTRDLWQMTMLGG